MACKEYEESTVHHDNKSKEISSQRQILDYHPDLLKLIDEIERSSFPSQPKPKCAPKDYVKENIKKVRELELKKAEGKAKHAQNVSCLKKYENVKPKVYDAISSPPKLLVNGRRVLKMKLVSSATCFKPQDCKPSDSTFSEYGRPSIQVEQDSDGNIELLSTNSTIFMTDGCHKFNNESTCSRSIHSNCICSEVCNTGDQNSSHISNRQIQSEKNDYYGKLAQDIKRKAILSRPHPLGHKPRYLLEEKRKQEEELKRQELEKTKADVPPGKELLSEEERVKTLTECQKRREQILFLLSKLPVTYLTKRQERYRNELERQLSIFEEGISVFSKSKVYIELDDNSNS